MPTHLRAIYEIESDYDGEETEAEFSSVFNPSSPQIATSQVLEDIEMFDGPNVTLNNTEYLSSDDSDSDDTYIPSSSPSRPTFPSAHHSSGSRASPQTDDEKVRAVLLLLKSMSRFSLKKFLVALFRSDAPDIKNFVGRFLMEDDGPLALLDIWYKMGGKRDYDRPLTGWIIRMAAKICNLEMSWLTDKAYEGPHYTDALALRVKPSDVTVVMIKAFDVCELHTRYLRLLPCFQEILTEAIGKENTIQDPTTRDPRHVRSFQLRIFIH